MTAFARAISPAMACWQCSGRDLPHDAPQLGELACDGQDAFEDAAGDGRLGHLGDADALLAPGPGTPRAVRRNLGFRGCAAHRKWHGRNGAKKGACKWLILVVRKGLE